MWIIILILLLCLAISLTTPKAHSEGSPTPSPSITESYVVAQTVVPSPKPKVVPPKIQVISQESKASLQEMVRATALKWGVDPALMARIVNCESGFKPNVKNTQSTASGIMQFLDGTYASYTKKYGITAPKSDPVAQVELAVRMIADGGLSHWNASKSCWG